MELTLVVADSAAPAVLEVLVELELPHSCAPVPPLSGATSAPSMSPEANHQGRNDTFEPNRPDDRRENAEVVRMVTEAAEQGHARAQYHLGYMYDIGLHVLENHALAVEWYRKAADQGDAQAQVNLARMYYFGLGGVPHDSAMALTLLLSLIHI